MWSAFSSAYLPFFFIYYCLKLFIYSHVHTLFGSFLSLSPTLPPSPRPQFQACVLRSCPHFLKNWAVFLFSYLGIVLRISVCSFCFLIFEWRDSIQAWPLCSSTSEGFTIHLGFGGTFLGSYRVYDLHTCWSFTYCGSAGLERNQFLFLLPDYMICGEKLLLVNWFHL
jgi:hypothetical protein